MSFRAAFEVLFDTRNRGATLFLFSTCAETVTDINCQLPLHVSFPCLAEEWRKIAACASCERSLGKEGRFLWLEAVISRRCFSASFLEGIDAQGVCQCSCSLIIAVHTIPQDWVLSWSFWARGAKQILSFDHVIGAAVCWHVVGHAHTSFCPSEACRSVSAFISSVTRMSEGVGLLFFCILLGLLSCSVSIHLGSSLLFEALLLWDLAFTFEELPVSLRPRTNRIFFCME